MAHVATREVSRLKTAVVVRVVRSTIDEVGDVLLVDAGRLGGPRGREVERRGRNRGRRAENELDEERGVHGETQSVFVGASRLRRCREGAIGDCDTDKIVIRVSAASVSSALTR